jgi:DNA (cytosine-5)-methyltransferase 1
MTAYYNENDKQTCAWLRELIKQDLIAPGDVDERDIRDVRSNDLVQFKQIHLFAGIGVWSYALRNAGWPDDRPILTGSCPCQPFSSAGKKDGTKDKRHLWPEMYRLIAGLPESKRPPTIFGEQVANAESWFDALQNDLARENYAAGLVVFPACSVGAPHLRQRLYWFADNVEQSNRDGRQQRATCHNDGRKRQRTTDQQNDRYKVWNDTGDTKPTDGMENTNSQRLKQQSILLQQKQGKDPQAAGRGSTDGVANNAGIGCEGVSRSGATQASKRITKLCETNKLGNAKHDGYPASTESGGHDENDNQSSQGAHGSGQPKRTGTSGIVRGDDDCERHDPSSIHAGPTNGYWRAADWIWCRDEKWRPVEPGLAPLVDGSAARVVRLRGFGNAIVAPQAQAFIESYLETE